MRLLLALSIVALAACDTVEAPRFTDFSTLSQDAELLVGSWELEYSLFYSGQSGLVRTLAQRGEESITFRADGTATEYRDGEVERETTYSTEDRCTDDGVCFVRLTIGGRIPAQWGVDAERFVLSDAALDGAERGYGRLD